MITTAQYDSGATLVDMGKIEHGHNTTKDKHCA